MNQIDNAVKKAEKRLKKMSPRDFYTGGNNSTCINEVTIKTAIWMSLPDDMLDDDNRKVFSEVRSHDADTEGHLGRSLTDIMFIGRGKITVVAIELKYVPPKFLHAVLDYIKDKRFEDTKKPLSWRSIPTEENTDSHPLYDENVSVSLHEWKAKKVMDCFHGLNLTRDTPYQKSVEYNKKTRKYDVVNSTLGELCDEAEFQVSNFATLTEGVTHTRTIVFVGDYKFHDVTNPL